MNDATHGATREDGTWPTIGNLPAGPVGFDLIDEVGKGGMGVVWRARDIALDREVAVKLLLHRYAADSDAARRFIDEARITGQLQHPGIPAVYQVGDLPGGRPFLAMKLIKGQTLDALLEDGAAIDVLSVFAAIAQAVGFAHDHGVIHRDLKPSNVMVGKHGEVQVMDWGLAKVLARGVGQRPEADPEATTAASMVRTERDSDTPYTQYGSLLGTPAYMAPEQAAGELDKVGPPADVFGLGAILCVLLTGKPPYDGRDFESIRIAAVRGQTAGALARLDACPADPEVIALCKRCLAFDPADRPANGESVAAEVEALRRAADERVRQAERDKLSAEVRAYEQAKRRRTVQWAAGLVAGVLLLGVIGTAIGLYRSNESRKAAVAAERATEEKRHEAVKAREGEASQKMLAQKKEAEANAVAKFFEDHVFSAARPKGQGGGQGKAVSLRDAIAASLPALDRAFAAEPLVEARLRHTLGITFAYLGEGRAAEAQFARGPGAPRRAPRPAPPGHAEEHEQPGQQLLSLGPARRRPQAPRGDAGRLQARTPPRRPPANASGHEQPGRQLRGPRPARRRPEAPRGDARRIQARASRRQPGRAFDHDHPGQHLRGPGPARRRPEAARGGVGRAEARAPRRPPGHSFEHEQPGQQLL